MFLQLYATRHITYTFVLELYARHKPGKRQLPVLCKSFFFLKAHRLPIYLLAIMRAAHGNNISYVSRPWTSHYIPQIPGIFTNTCPCCLLWVLGSTFMCLNFVCLSSFPWVSQDSYKSYYKSDLAVWLYRYIHLYNFMHWVVFFSMLWNKNSLSWSCSTITSWQPVTTDHQLSLGMCIWQLYVTIYAMQGSHQSWILCHAFYHT